MNSTKPELRKALRAARMTMTAEDRGRKSLEICAGLLRSVDWSGVRSLHCYEPIANLGEVDVTGFIADLKDGYPELRIYTSRKLDGGWKVVSVDSGEPVEPAPGFDAVIVPMLGFDPQLHRIGFGGGYYDRFLAAQPQARKIGVCFEQGLVRRVPHEAHDIRLDMVLTERRILTP
ncbi:MAG: 5-formyltetrahydrofolate cyclo-ligase [Candidatus Saccharimonadales bacterium]